MAFTGSGKIWMNGSLVDWADAKIHIASHVIHYGSAVFEGARCYDTPRGSACFQLDAHMRRLYDSAKIYRMEPQVDRDDADRGRARDDSRQRVQGVLHPADRLSRLQHARRRSVGVSGRFGHPHVGVGRVSREGSARTRRRRRDQLVDARGAEHLPVAREERGELRQLAADQDVGASPTATARASPSTPPAISAKAAARTSSSSATRSSTRRPSRRPSSRASRATRSSRLRATSASRCAKSCCRASCSTSPTRRSSSARRSRSRRSGRSTRLSSATAGAGRSPKRCRAAFFDIINGVRPDTHGWLTYVSPGAPQKALQSAHASQ